MASRVLFPTLVLMTLAVADAGNVFADSSGNSRPPNIVILYADDMGYGDLAIQNPESKIPTPHLDALARQGMRFTDAHSSSGICTPSRYALLTGRYHWRKFHNIVGSFDPPSFDDELTLARMLQEKGYATAAIGKWHLGWNWDAIRRPGAEPRPKLGYRPDDFDWTQPIPGGPLDRGFDYYFGDDVPNFPPYAWLENDKVVDPPSEELSITPETAEGNWEARPGPMVSDWDFYAVMPTLTRAAVRWIGEQKGSDRPFFLYFPFTSPHAPIVPAPEFVGKSQAGGYGDFVVQTDWTVGRVLQALDEHGFSENTLVIFTSDNGPERYAYERIRNFGHYSAGPLRGLKRDIWEGGHRVPFVVRYPPAVAAGEVNDGLISQVDIMATIASLVGFELPDDSADDSHDLWQCWTGGSPSPRTATVHNTFAEGYAYREGDWLLINAPTGAVTRVPPWFEQQHGYQRHDLPGELYNLRDDLAQRKNLFAEMPQKAAEMQAKLQQVRESGEVR